jgi:hypothetical protein
MKNGIPQGHPYWHVRQIVESDPQIRELFFSSYVYRPQSLIDERNAFSLHRDQFLDEEKVCAMLQNQAPQWEVAFHSTVKTGSGEFAHLPLIDMSVSAKAHLAKLSEFIGADLFAKFCWFDSGRSFHGYGGSLISPIEWRQFMGRLLIANQKDMKPTVDPRWVGHRLIAGYSALRWTKATEYYLVLPTKLEKLV